MQVILEVLGALTPSMAVIDTENLEFGPLIGWYTRRLLGRLDYVQDDRNSVLVCFPYDSHVRVGSEGLYCAESLGTDLTSLKEGKRALWLVLFQ